MINDDAQRPLSHRMKTLHCRQGISAATLLILATLAFPAAAELPATNATQLLSYEQYALTHAGDARRGERLFLDSDSNKCITCHRVGEEGGQVGPDLSHIGGKFDRPHLIESLLEPSRQIVEGYRVTTVVTDAGRVVTGIIKSESETAITLLDANSHQIRISKDEIEQRRIQTVSLMPTGLAETLTLDQFTDLIAYLETLRPGGKPKFGEGVFGPVTLPAGFEIETVATNLTGATALETLPDGRVLVCEQTGSLRVVKEGQLLDEPMLTVDVDSNWERGLVGVTVAPDFPADPYVYVCYVAKEPYTHHRISRFRVRGDLTVPGSEQILLKGDDQSTLGGHVPAGHQGGGLHFGHDGQLYVGIGEQTANTPAQELDTLQGKILRLNPDGSIPIDNPFLHRTEGKYQSIWAIGCRNPFTFSVEPTSGLMLINDVGGEFEEINRGLAGANYGWPTIDHGPSPSEDFTGPIHIYPQASIAGGDFPPATDRLPQEYRERYFFGDFVHGWIRTIAPHDPEEASDFATGLRRPVDLRFASNGSLYVLLRNAWVIDGKFQPDTGSLLRIYPTSLGKTHRDGTAGLQPWHEKPWYWARRGAPVLLLGGSDDDNLFQWPQERLIPQLDRLVAAGGNVIRNTMSDRRDAGFEVYPFQQLANGKYDLDQWNPEYWQRFERLLAETAKRNILVQIEVWDRFDYTDGRANDPQRWENHPYNPQNNVNYSFADSGFEQRYPDHPGANKQPFFFTTPKQRNNAVVLQYQARFVNRLLDHALPYDHVLYCIDNETKAEPEWGEYWARLIKRRAHERNQQVMVTEMWDDWNLRAARHRQTFDHPELYDFVDVSQNNHNSGQQHWDNFLHVRNYLAEHPRPMNTTKTYGADGNKFKHTDQDAIERFWRHLLAGAASIRFHRPSSGLGLNDKAVACIKAARSLEELMPLWTIEPAHELLGQRTDNEAYAAASADRASIAVYFPATKTDAEREVSVDLSATASKLTLRWLDIDQGRVLGPSAISDQRRINLRPPGMGNFTAVLTANPSL